MISIQFRKLIEKHSSEITVKDGGEGTAVVGSQLEKEALSLDPTARSHSMQQQQQQQQGQGQGQGQGLGLIVPTAHSILTNCPLIPAEFKK